MREDLIFHLVPKRDWDQWQEEGLYKPPSLGEKGYIQCSSGGQIEDSANRIFEKEKRLMLLVIDVPSLQADLKYEETEIEGTSQKSPHIYGALNINAVIDKIHLYPDKAGNYEIGFESKE